MTREDIHSQQLVLRHSSHDQKAYLDSPSCPREIFALRGLRDVLVVFVLFGILAIALINHAIQ